ncbi:MAG: dUTP diphosphatase, partial [Candidatus Brocadiales bacterium]
MKRVRVNIKRRGDCEDLPIPKYMSAGASGVDLHAAVNGELVLAPSDIRAVPTGVFIELPSGYEAQVRP